MIVNGEVYCECTKGVQVYLRGKAHVEWRITRGGERRTVKEDQYFIDEKTVVWGRGTLPTDSMCPDKRPPTSVPPDRRFPQNT